MAIISQETSYNEGESAMVVCPCHISEFLQDLAKPLQETIRHHSCLQAKLPMVTKQEAISSGNEFCTMVCPLCPNEPSNHLRKPIQETRPCQDHSLVLLPTSSAISATGPYLAVAKKKVIYKPHSPQH